MLDQMCVNHGAADLAWRVPRDDAPLVALYTLGRVWHQSSERSFVTWSDEALLLLGLHEPDVLPHSGVVSGVRCVFAHLLQSLSA